VQSVNSGDFEAHNMSPHHWIHKVDGIKDSTDLGGGIFFGTLVCSILLFFWSAQRGAPFFFMCSDLECNRTAECATRADFHES
jgi:hypothetical protein